MRRIILFALLMTGASSAAITVDSFAVGPQSTAASSNTWTHTCGTNALLYVAVMASASGTQTVTANGVSMTSVAAGTGYNLQIFQLYNCTGSQTILTSQPYAFLSGSSISFLGASQSLQPNASTNASSGTLSPGTNYATSITSSANNALTVQFLAQNFGQGSVYTAGAGTTVVIPGTVSLSQMPSIAISSTAITPAGSSTQNVTSNANQSNWSVTLAISPFGALGPPVQTQGFFF